MQPSSDRSAGSSHRLRRYGPLALIVVLLVAVGGIVAFGGDDEPAASSGDGGGGDAILADGEVGAPTPTGSMPLTYKEAEEAGTVDDYDWGDRCDPETGLVKIPTVYAAPCVPVFDGDNGGATASGVTADTIKIVRYIGDSSADATALLNGMDVNDTPATQSDTLRDYFEVYASRMETYGRKVELVDYKATGAPDDVVAAKADATQIASELKPFAVYGGPNLDRGTFAQELTSHGILCYDCAGPVPEAMVADMRPLVWGGLPSAEQFLVSLAAWSSNLGDLTPEEEAAAGQASFAGDPEMRDQPRKNGVIHFDQDPPVFEVSEDDVPEGIALIESYVFDFATMPQKATELVAKFKAAGITTIEFLGDPVMPIYLTSAATDQDYFPEWVFTGTVLTDTNVFARQYNPEQMAHAFGISQLAAPTAPEIQDPLVVYRWYFGADAFPPARAQYAVYHGPARFLMNGIHMAGPELTAENFARGQFRIPPAGGGPTTPQVSFGSWGFFPTVDYAGIDDSTEIWWDPSVEAPDETGQDGKGVWRRAHKGLRFINEDDAPTPAPFADPDDTVTVLDELPAEDTPPDYPAPPGSPAAQ
jgi:hypothetical protein